MSAEVIDIGRYVKVPYDVVKSKLSHRAFRVWSLIAAGASPENPVASVRQSTLADEIGCSTDTIGRAIAELLKHGLLCEAGKWNQGRCKIYRLSWSTRVKVVDAPPTVKRAEPEREAPNTELSELLAAHGTMWGRAYECFDGESGRPTLRACVDEALSNSSRAKGTDLKTFVEGWLHIASQRWRVQKAPPPATLARDGGESAEEREWIIAQIKLDNEKQRRKDAMEARQRASYVGRGAVLANNLAEPKIHKPICRENYPLSWAFLKIKWAELHNKVAA